MESDRLSFMFPDTVQALEDRAVRAWPPEESIEANGWVVRYTAQASTRRANSVFSSVWRDTGFLNKSIEQVEAFYRRHDRQPRFQITPASKPDSLDSALEDRGYEIEAPVVVQWAHCENVLARAGDPDGVTATNDVRHEWQEIFSQFVSDPRDAAGRVNIIRRISPPRTLASLRQESVGLGVLDENWCGIFCMHTLSSFQRQGNADKILGAIACWTKQQGGHYLYLQVEEDNSVARSFYETRGFATAYAYHYRTLWEA